MIDDDDLIPERPRGRRMRGMVNGLRQPPGAGADTPRCRQCEKWSARQGWCPLRASINNGMGPMCRYGVALYMAKRRKERRDGKQ